MIRTNTRANVFLLCGGIFFAVGIVIFVAGIFLTLNFDYVVSHGQGDVELLPILFLLIGGITMATGFALLTICIRKWLTKRRLLEQGEYVIAEITDIPVDYTVRVNGWPTFRVECCYQDSITNARYFFHSENLLLDPSYCITQSTVKVFVNQNTGYKDYYVDIDSILPQTASH